MNEDGIAGDQQPGIFLWAGQSCQGHQHACKRRRDRHPDRLQRRRQDDDAAHSIRFVSPQGVRGEILFDGQTIQKNPGYKIARLGLYQVLEGRHVFPKLTVEENLATGAYNVRDSKQVKDGIREVYRLFPRLEERKTSFGGNLSGGEQQMLAIGRALINRPKLMILDEPSLGLAPIIIREIFESIKRINAEGTTILFVEQNARIALATAQRGYVLQTGKIELGTN